jgi:TrmH family RNA methyltransferase
MDCTITELIHVFLVETQDSINIGNVARAMSNLGFTNLHLVAPRNWDIGRAKASGCGAEEILNNLKIHPNLTRALEGMNEAVAFSSRGGKNRPNPTDLPIWITEWSKNIKGKTALVFGPEDTGLTNEHLLFCGDVVRIPTASLNSSFNLSQAVLLALYELSPLNASLTATVVNFEAPDWSEQLQLSKIVDDLMWESNFYRKETPHTVPGLVRQLIFRIKPDVRELAILLGMFSSVKNLISRLKNS